MSWGLVNKAMWVRGDTATRFMLIVLANRARDSGALFMYPARQLAEIIAIKPSRAESLIRRLKRDGVLEHDGRRGNLATLDLDRALEVYGALDLDPLKKDTK